MTALLAAFVTFQASVSPFDASYQAHVRARNVSASIEVSGNDQSRKQRRTINVSAYGDDILMRVREPATASADRSDRTFLLKGAKVVAYDATANERLSRTPVGKDRLTRLESVLGEADESVAMVLSPARLKKFLDSLKSMGGWKQKRTASLLTLSRGATSTGYVAVSFGTKDHLLRSLTMKNPSSFLEWRINYATPKPPTLTIPASARLVASFTVASAPPKFGSAAAESVYRRMIATAEATTSATVAVDGNGRKVRIVFTNGVVKQIGSDWTWLFDGQVLSAYDRTKNRFYRGKALRADVIDTLVVLGAPIHSYAREALVLSRAPFSGMMEAGSIVKIAGTMRAGGISKTILRGTSPRKRVSMSVRNDIHLPDSISIEFLDAKGGVISSSTAHYDYARLNKPQLDVDRVMPVPTGTSVLPLPKV